MRTTIYITFCLCLIFSGWRLQAQTLKEYPDSVVLYDSQVRIVFHTANGAIDYHFAGPTDVYNAVGYVLDTRTGLLLTTSLAQHPYSTDAVHDSLGDGIRINIRHMDDRHAISLVQRITLYADRHWVLTDITAASSTGQATVETRNISPLAILPSQQGRVAMSGSEPRILDEPFDNDDWVGVVERHWPDAAGISYEFSALYDNAAFNGLVMGSLTHDCWKTGIVYHTGAAPGQIDSLVVYGGAATPDVPSLPRAYGGRDGTHDVMPHGTLTGAAVASPLIYLGGGTDIRGAFTGYGRANARINGSLDWKGNAPVYWNSFGVEGVLGYEKVMMPPGVAKVSDYLHSLDNFSRWSPPVLSVDSYDQSIYTTDLLASLSKYAKKNGQQMGFYFGPFVVWTWKNSVEQTKLPGTNFSLGEAVLKDEQGKPIAYKDGDWGAYPIDPTHPATRQYIITQLQKAKAIHATFLKIDFLTCGALESITHSDPAISTGMQAYNYGMKMVKHLIDSILGPDIFITEAISPMFPHQYAHTRFISTDVYSHLRDDEKGFPSWGSTEASLATGAHLGWVQGTLWPFTNLDVCIMQHFQKNPDLSEQEIRVRLYAMMVMGSILGDGSDFRQPLAAQRGRKYLNDPRLCAFFSRPQAFLPLKYSDGDGFDQQMAFYGKAKDTLLGLFNFNTHEVFRWRCGLDSLGLKKGKYLVKEFLTGATLATVEAGQDVISLTIPPGDALMAELIPQ
ncbi:hypothetical protein [Puia dinghuensis]|uniref:Alpha-galactosidase n=1 Tax=Puia dinghuensis TaxID=1792502 RepID=A0A8J2XTC6_9BACT|nr:hypothetical protein [Puia dinghuensis]GGB02391.1 alpha-galactosidase [Puia dinghuensis]